MRHMFSSLAIAAVVALAMAVTPACAETAPEPRRSVDIDRFMGRWYEIIRTPNNRQKNCHAAHQVWTRKADGAFDIDQVCHLGDRNGPARHVDTAARIVDPATNAKFEASFFGGLIRRQYWVIDHGDDYGWMIASTSDGKFVALLARTPGLAPPRQSSLKARMRALGFANALEEVGAKGF
jgi:apolipoprotein D and lipocalin family protein